MPINVQKYNKRHIFFFLWVCFHDDSIHNEYVLGGVEGGISDMPLHLPPKLFKSVLLSGHPTFINKPASQYRQYWRKRLVQYTNLTWLWKHYDTQTPCQLQCPAPPLPLWEAYHSRVNMKKTYCFWVESSLGCQFILKLPDTFEISKPKSCLKCLNVDWYPKPFLLRKSRRVRKHL